MLQNVTDNLDYNPSSISNGPVCAAQIERFINSPGTHNKPPNYSDILHQVVRANKRHGLCLNAEQREEVAREAFTETGKRVQERRHLDLVYNFGSRLTDTYKPCETRS